MFAPTNLLHQSLIANVLFRLNLHLAAIEMKGYVISEVSYPGTEPDLLLYYENNLPITAIEIQTSRLSKEKREEKIKKLFQGIDSLKNVYYIYLPNKTTEYIMAERTQKSHRTYIISENAIIKPTKAKIKDVVPNKNASTENLMEVSMGLLGPVYNKIDNLDSRMDNLDSRMDNLDSRMDNLDSRIDNLDKQLNGRMDNLEKTLQLILKKLS